MNVYKLEVCVIDHNRYRVKSFRHEDLMQGRPG